MPLIFLNPGHHPGIDPGAVNNNTGLREADVCKDISNKVRDYLTRVGYKCKVLQDDNLVEVCNQANELKADLFVSIHCNGHYDEKANGTKTYYSDGSSEGQKLASFVQNQLVDSMKTINRGVKTANFYVLRKTTMPAILIETAFISNCENEKILADEFKRSEIAAAIARGISDYYA